MGKVSSQLENLTSARDATASKNSLTMSIFVKFILVSVAFWCLKILKTFREI